MNRSSNEKLVLALHRLADMHVFFGHQSVGRNILNGISKLSEDADVGVRIGAIEHGVTVSEANILEAHLGKNGVPSSKVREFVRLMDAGIADQVDVAFMKFCYVDAAGTQDADTVLREYVSETERLEMQFPQTTFLYVTMPLRALRTDLKRCIKGMLGIDRRWRQENVERNHFNAMLRELKGSSGRLFDLARIEATRPDGSLEAFRLDGRVWEAMYPDYTADGGHLNETGRRIAAEKLITLLSTIAGGADRYT
jgi:hypothetical protein